MSTEFPSANLTAGQLNAIVKKLGGHDMALHFLRDELSVSESTRSWREENDVIYFSVTSDGTTGEDWIKRLESNGFRVDDYAKPVLRSPDFKPTSGVTTEVAVLKGVIFKEADRIPRIMNTPRVVASKRKLETPNAEIACLILEKFTDEELKAMGLVWIIVVHEPISVSGSDLYLLGASRSKHRTLRTFSHRSDCEIERNDGFAFIVSQVSS